MRLLADVGKLWAPVVKKHKLILNEVPENM